jgi:hypothetical protein
MENPNRRIRNAARKAFRPNPTKEATVEPASRCRRECRRHTRFSTALNGGTSSVCYQAHAAAALGKSCHPRSQNDIQYRKGEPCHNTDLEVGQIELGFNRFYQYLHDDAVDKTADIDTGKHHQCPPG